MMYSPLMSMIYLAEPFMKPAVQSKTPILDGGLFCVLKPVYPAFPFVNGAAGLCFHIHPSTNKNFLGGRFMEFFAEAINMLKILVIAIGAGLGAWGVVNLLEGYGSDNPGAKSQG